MGETFFKFTPMVGMMEPQAAWVFKTTTTAAEPSSCFDIISQPAFTLKLHDTHDTLCNEKTFTPIRFTVGTDDAFRPDSRTG
jgi:hypothetical protein